MTKTLILPDKPIFEEIKVFPEPEITDPWLAAKVEAQKVWLLLPSVCPSEHEEAMLRWCNDLPEDVLNENDRLIREAIKSIFPDKPIYKVWQNFSLHHFADRVQLVCWANNKVILTIPYL